VPPPYELAGMGKRGHLLLEKAKMGKYMICFVEETTIHYRRVVTIHKATVKGSGV